MKIGVYSRKGGVGKSSLSVSLSSYFEEAIVLSNDKAGRFHKYEFYEAVEEPGEYDYEGTLIYDFGGFVGPDVLDVLGRCDVVLIPTDDDESGIQELLDAVAQVQEYHDRIILVHNKSSKDEMTPQAVIEDNFGDKYPLLRVRTSKGFRNALYEGVTLTQLAGKDGKNSYSYRNVLADIEALAEAVKIIGGYEDECSA